MTSLPLRRTTAIDALLGAADDALRTLSGSVSASRPTPATRHAVPESEDERRLSAGLMRVNHTGEVCAQALYSGQALVAREVRVRDALQAAASEERDHLAWCRERLGDLGEGPSLLDPLWYAGSFAWGMASGLAGDRWSLAFLVETEAQVERHLAGHLERLPDDDHASREIVDRMREDEMRHGASGRALGAAELPSFVKSAMRVAARLMTRTAFRI